MTGCSIEEEEEEEDQPGIDAAAESQKLLEVIQRRRRQEMGTSVKDLLEDREGMVTMRRRIEAMRNRRVQEKLVAQEAAVDKKISNEKEPSYECLLPVSVLSRQLQVVADTGASHSIISYRTVRKLKLKNLIRPSRKAFVTAGGELSFPVGELEELPVNIGGRVVKVNCMIVGKSCFSMLIGLEVMKPLGAVLDTFSFDGADGKVVFVPITCHHEMKTLNDIKLSANCRVFMIRPIPASKGPVQGQSFEGSHGLVTTKWSKKWGWSSATF